MAGLTVDSVSTVRGYVTLTFVGKGDKPARVPVPLPALPAVQAAIAGRTSGPLLRTCIGGGMERRSVHRYLARTAQAAGSADPSGRTHCVSRSVRSGSTRAFRCATFSACCATPAPRPRASYDISGDALEGHASHEVAGFLAGWTS